MSKAILVTGAAGFIGSHVTESLLARGDVVVGLDNLNDYYSPARKRANLEEVERQAPASQRFIPVTGDIRDGPLLDSLFQEYAFTTVVHLAAMAGVRASIDAPRLYYDVNVLGTLALLEAARQYKTSNVVFASTSSVYGDTPQIPFVETDSCLRPLSPYASSKRSAELLGFSSYHLYGLPFTALRLFTVYGPRGRPDMLAYKVADSIVHRRRVPLYNSGQMYRDWTYVSDIVQGILAAVDRPLGYQVINLGRGEPILLADFVSLIEGCAGGKAHLVDAPMPDTDIARTHADVTRAHSLLGYTPQVSVAEGVQLFWQWYEGAVLSSAGPGQGPIASTTAPFPHARVTAS